MESSGISIRFKCRSCGQKLEADDDTFGMTLPCPGCGVDTVVPSTKSRNPSKSVRASHPAGPKKKIVLIFGIASGIVVVALIAIFSVAALLSDRTITLDDGSVYRGETKGGMPHGKGERDWPDGSTFKGTFADGYRAHGKTVGMAAGNRYVYEGDYKNGEFHGKGIWTSPNGTRHTGEFRGGQPNGWGTQASQAYSFTGMWKDGLPDGPCTMTQLSDGATISGKFVNGEFQPNVDTGSVDEFADGLLKLLGALGTALPDQNNSNAGNGNRPQYPDGDSRNLQTSMCWTCLGEGTITTRSGYVTTCPKCGGRGRHR